MAEVNSVAPFRFQWEMHSLRVARRTADIEREVPPLHWRVTLRRSSDNSALILAVLEQHTPTARARAMAYALVYQSSEHSEHSDDEIRQWVQEGVIEGIYDLCRRALNAQASWLDADLDLPIFAPNKDVEMFAEDDADTD